MLRGVYLSALEYSNKYNKLTKTRGRLMAKGKDAQKTDKKKSETTLKEKRKAKKDKKDKKSGI